VAAADGEERVALLAGAAALAEPVLGAPDVEADAEPSLAALQGRSEVPAPDDSERRAGRGTIRPLTAAIAVVRPRAASARADRPSASGTASRSGLRSAREATGRPRLLRSGRTAELRGSRRRLAPASRRPDRQVLHGEHAVPPHGANAGAGHREVRADDASGVPSSWSACYGKALGRHGDVLPPARAWSRTRGGLAVPLLGLPRRRAAWTRQRSVDLSPV
jgi:hypothetical protein